MRGLLHQAAHTPLAHDRLTPQPRGSQLVEGHDHEQLHAGPRRRREPRSPDHRRADPPCGGQEDGARDATSTPRRAPLGPPGRRVGGVAPAVPLRGILVTCFMSHVAGVLQDPGCVSRLPVRSPTRRDSRSIGLRHQMPWHALRALFPHEVATIDRFAHLGTRPNMFIRQRGGRPCPGGAWSADLRTPPAHRRGVPRCPRWA
jgi:hypothetical protein